MSASFTMDYRAEETTETVEIGDMVEELKINEDITIYGDIMQITPTDYVFRNDNSEAHFILEDGNLVSKEPISGADLYPLFKKN